MDYKVVVSIDAEQDFENYLQYLLYEKKSEQAARNFIADFNATKSILANIAASLKYCDNPKLKELGYKRINFLKHKYFMLFRIEDDIVIIDNIFHALQDYENYLV